MRAVALHATGCITQRNIEASNKRTTNDDTIKRLTFPALIPAISERERKNKVTRPSAFRGGKNGWQAPTSSMYKLAVQMLTDEDFFDLIAQAKEVSRASRRNAKEAESDYDPDDSLMEIANASAPSSDVDMDVRPAGQVHHGTKDSDKEDNEEEDEDGDDGDENMVDHSGIFDDE